MHRVVRRPLTLPTVQGWVPAGLKDRPVEKPAASHQAARAVSEPTHRIKTMTPTPVHPDAGDQEAVKSFEETGRPAVSPSLFLRPLISADVQGTSMVV